MIPFKFSNLLQKMRELVSYLSILPHWMLGAWIILGMLAAFISGFIKFFHFFNYLGLVLGFKWTRLRYCWMRGATSWVRASDGLKIVSTTLH